MNNKNNLFPVVGIGCSAGGLDALKSFFKHLPTKPDVSFIIIMHLDPNRKTELNEILAQLTELEVKLIMDNEEIKNNIIYIRPPNKNIILRNNIFHLEEIKKPRGQRLPIDYSFQSIAVELEDKSIGIILSGTGTDGTLGLRKIKGHGGIAMIQDPKEAKYPGMPNSVLTHVEVDYILPVRDMPKEILRYTKNYVKPSPSGRYVTLSTKVSDNIGDIIRSLQSNDGEKLLAYKKSTLSRRISKRMAVNHIYSLEEYGQYLKDHSSERDKLFEEVLIGVTEFFRDGETFDILKDKVISKLIDNKKEDESIRVWVVGCSTGEEAYSIALIFKELLNQRKKDQKVVIFASDANNKAINKARSGKYPENISENVPEEYLERYFTLEDSTFKIKQEIRNMVVFAHHNAITDPPFSDIDLISCRNFLIYLKTNIQEKLLKIFHYSLKKNGFLFLGNAETVGVNSDLYSEVNRKAKIFKRKRYSEHLPGYTRPFPPLIDYEIRNTPEKLKKEAVGDKQEDVDYEHLMKEIMLRDYSPSSVIINSNNEIIYAHGRTGKYLEPPVGKAELDILKMARQGLDLIIASAIRKARTLNEEIKIENIEVNTNGDKIRINLIVRPIENPPTMEGLLLIVFEENLVKLSDLTENKIEESIDKFAQQRIDQLENELKYTKTYLQSTVEELESTNEELKAANEELQSSNEELKSTNEELQTSKEELQSVNEELMTVNNELENKVEQLTTLNNDLKNLIESTDIATIFLGSNLEIQRFTPPAKEVFNLIDNDIGRKIRDISSNLEYKKLIEDISKVQDDLIPIEKDVKAESNEWYTMRIMPYRTEDDRIEGTVLTFFNITEKKKAEQKLKQSEQKFKEAYKQTDFYKDLLTHDFNNLLQVILLNINQLENEIEDLDETMISRVKEQIYRGKNLIESIQRLAKIDYNISKTTSINLVNLIREKTAQIKEIHHNKHIEIGFDYPKDKLYVNASQFLDEAIQNLLNNSIIHNNQEIKEINIQIRQYKQKNNEYYKISIEDNGKGISDDQKKQIMEGTTFRKLNLTKGMGIGLSIVKKVIKISEGEMWIENKSEADYTKGTRVILLLPKRATAESKERS